MWGHLREFDWPSWIALGLWLAMTVGAIIFAILHA
jgi:hypothetical protein